MLLAGGNEETSSYQILSISIRVLAKDLLTQFGILHLSDSKILGNR